jgi:serine/threonine-protein kinase CTR1
MEYLSKGSLASILSNKNIELEYDLRMEMLIDTARGINYLHNFKPPIIHRDLKTDNLLVIFFMRRL